MGVNHNIQRLRDAGVSIWLDTLSRQLLRSGEFEVLTRDYGVTGVTSNPTIFANAIRDSDLYDGQLRALEVAGEGDPRELFFDLALADVTEAAGVLRGEYVRTTGRDGLVSFECTPDLADDTDATIAQALDLWHRLEQPNVMIKVPGTEAGLPAIEELTRLGVNVNVTLLFSVERYEQVMDSYVRGLEARARDRQPLGSVTSTASFFLSRIDSKVDPQLPERSPLRGQVALASARVAYARYVRRFSGPEWDRLVQQGARTQRPLWASTATKNSAYSDLLYVSDLVAPDVVSTMPVHTLRAFADHGDVRRTIGTAYGAARRTLAGAGAAGVDLPSVTSALEREGIAAFCDSYHQLLDIVQSKLGAIGSSSR